MSVGTDYHTHTGHVCGAARCVHKTDIHGPKSGIPGSRQKTHNGVANKKVQWEIDKCKQNIEWVKRSIKDHWQNTPEDRNARQAYKRQLTDLTQQLAQLQAREYYPIKRAQKTKQVQQAPRQQVASPAKTTDSEPDSDSRGSPSDRLYGSKNHPSPLGNSAVHSPVVMHQTPPGSLSLVVPQEDEVVDLAAYLRPSTSRSVHSEVSSKSSVDLLAVFGAEEEPSGLLEESQRPGTPDSLDRSEDGLPDLAAYLRPSTPSSVHSKSSSESSVDLLAVFGAEEEPSGLLEESQRPGTPDSLARSEDELLSPGFDHEYTGRLSPFSDTAPTVAAPVENRAEKAPLVQQYIETADRVRQVFALVVTRIAAERTMPALIEPSAPLADEFDDIDRAMNEKIKTGRDAMDEHVLPRIASDLKSQKSRYIREQREHLQFIETTLKALPNTPETATVRARLEKHKEFLSKELPADPTVAPEVFSSFRRRDNTPIPRLSGDELSQLKAKAQTKTIAELRESIDEQRQFLSSLDQEIIEMDVNDPNVAAMLVQQRKIGVLPQQYIDAYSALLEENAQLSTHDIALNQYFSDIDSAAGKYESMRRDLQSQRASICQYVHAHVLPKVADKAALETAMTEFHPKGGSSS